jgi:hypothetical protein
MGWKKSSRLNCFPYTFTLYSCTLWTASVPKGPGWVRINPPDKTVSHALGHCIAVHFTLYSQPSLWTTSVPKGPGWAGKKPPGKTGSLHVYTI